MISIIIPTHKRPDMLERALNSIRAQTVQSWEALVVDDGDGEGLERVAQLADPRIRAYPNWGQGQCDARNTALLRCECEYIALLDDDDWWEDTHHLERTLEQLRRHTALIYSSGFLVMEQHGFEQSRIPFDARATPSSLRQDNTLLASAVAYPRIFHDLLGGFDDRMGHYWDWDWYLRVVEAGLPLMEIQEYGVCIALHSDNNSGMHHTLERQRDLNMLCQKHGLGKIPIKNHLSLLLERTGLQGAVLSKTHEPMAQLLLAQY
jgi:glycosyltransferase involved in cell wall biosynthesis